MQPPRGSHTTHTHLAALHTSREFSSLSNSYSTLTTQLKCRLFQNILLLPLLTYPPTRAAHTPSSMSPVVSFTVFEPVALPSKLGDVDRNGGGEEKRFWAEAQLAQ